jgi:hypothetical protein
LAQGATVLAVPDEPPKLVVPPPELVEPPLAADVPPELESVLTLLPPALVVVPPVPAVVLPPGLVVVPPVPAVVLPPGLVVVPPLLPVALPPLLAVVPPLPPPLEADPEPPTEVAGLPPEDGLPPDPGVAGLQEQPHTTTPHKISLDQAVIRMFCLAYPRTSVCVDQLVVNRQPNRWRDV